MRKFKPLDLLSVRQLGKLQVSADGKVAGVVVSCADRAKNKQVSTFYLFNPVRRSFRACRLNSLQGWGHVLSPDGKRVAFIATPKGEKTAQLYIGEVRSGRCKKLTSMPLGVLEPRWLPNCKGIVFVSTVYRDALDLKSAAAKKASLEESKVKVKATESIWHKHWDSWFTDGELAHLFFCDLSAKRPRVRDLTPRVKDLFVCGLSWRMGGDSFAISPDSTEVCFVASRVSGDREHTSGSLFVTDLRTARVSELGAQQNGYFFAPVYHPDGEKILCGINFDSEYYANPVRLALIDRRSRKITVLTSAWDRSAGDWAFSSDGTKILLVAEDQAQCGFFEMPLKPGVPREIFRGGSFLLPRLLGDYYYFALSRIAQVPELHAFSTEKGQIERVSNFGSELSRVQFGKVEQQKFRGAAGASVQAFVVYPPNFDSRRKWPVLHLIHGGPHNGMLDCWQPRWNAQIFASAGYIVTWVNFHGSSSFGDAFARSIVGDWGRKPGFDVLAFHRKMARRPFVDRARSAIAGASYGGYLVSWLIGHSRAFKAAVVHAGVVDLMNIYSCDAVSGVGKALPRQVWQDPTAIDRDNPVRFSKNMRTPTLVVHGEKDQRVTLGNATELFGILRSKGVPSRLVLFEDENHWVLKPENSLRWYAEVLGWLKRFV